jgi:hypothetical protein
MSNANRPLLAALALALAPAAACDSGGHEARMTASTSPTFARTSPTCSPGPRSRNLAGRADRDVKSLARGRPFVLSYAPTTPGAAVDRHWKGPEGC